MSDLPLMSDPWSVAGPQGQGKGSSDAPGPQWPRPLGHSGWGIHPWSKAAAPGAAIAEPEENGAVEPKEESFVL